MAQAGNPVLEWPRVGQPVRATSSPLYAGDIQVDAKLTVTLSGTATAGASGVTPSSTPYDPHTEQDHRIRSRIQRDPDNGEPIFKQFDYYVGDVVLEILATNNNYEDVLVAYPELTRDDLDAALRFYELHRQELRGYLG